MNALEWLAAQQVLTGCSVITSLPDVSELPNPSLESWRAWFSHAASEIFRVLPDDGIAIFYQTDIKVQGVWIDKGYLVTRAADDARVPMIFHKIVCRVPAGTATFGRPAFAHLLGFSRGVRLNLALSTPDVLPGTGEMTWSRAMGVEPCKAACTFILRHTTTRTVVDPFCGLGTALAVANALGMHGVGVELAKKRAQRARNLVIQLGGSPPE